MTSVGIANLTKDKREEREMDNGLRVLSFPWMCPLKLNLHFAGNLEWYIQHGHEGMVGQIVLWHQGSTFSSPLNTVSWATFLFTI